MEGEGLLSYSAAQRLSSSARSGISEDVDCQFPQLFLQDGALDCGE